MQPYRQLGQLHRHRVLVDAVDDALEDHAPDQVAVVEQGRVDAPARVLGAGEDAFAQVLDLARDRRAVVGDAGRSEEHTSELQSLMRTSYAVFCLKKKKKTQEHQT